MADNFATHCRTNAAGQMEFYDKITSTAVFGGSATNGLVALAGGGQTGATPIVSLISRFTTVATTADSSLLPLSAPGCELTIVNAGAQSMNVYPQVGEAINASAVNVAIALAAGKTMTAACAVTGTWNTMTSA